MSDEDNEIGKNLTKLRGERTQQEVADSMRKLGWKWSQATVWSIEKGERPLRLAEARDLAALLSQRVDDFLDPSPVVAALEDLNRCMEKIKDTRQAFEKLAKAWKWDHHSLDASIAYAESTLEEWQVRNSVQDRVLRTTEVAKELLSWTPESMVASVMRDIRGKHPEEG